MDIQTNLVFSINKNSFKKTIQLSNYKNKDNVINFSEYDTISLLSNFENEDEFIIIETAINEITLDTRQNYAILSNFDNNQLYVPGIYLIKHYCNKHFTDYYFTILPNNINYNELEKIKLIIEYYHSGLIKNKLLKQLLSNSEQNKGNYGFISTINFIKNNQTQLFEILVGIINNPITNLLKKYKYTSDFKKPDCKSIRKLSQIGMNNNYKNPYYQKHSILSHDVIENIWLFYAINEILDLLISLQSNFLEYKSLIELQITKEELFKIQLTENYNTIKYDNSISSNYKSKLSSRKNYTKIVIQEKKHLLKELCLLNKELIPTLEYLNHIRTNEFFKSLSLQYTNIHITNKIIKDYRYNWIYNYLEHLKGNVNNNDTLRPNYRNKSTSLLYEYYSVILIIHILENLGFIWNNGWIKDDSKIYEELSSATRLIFSRDNETIYIDYDREIPYENEGLISDFIAINSFNRKPDILLSYFINDSIKSSVIFEVKYRKSHNIYNEMGDTKVIEQMKNYLQIAYYDTNKQKPELGIIKKVAILYPHQENIINYKDRIYSTVFEFISLSPNNQYETDIAYNKINKIITSIIDES